MKGGDELDVPMGDGFRGDPEEPDATWVTWDMAQSWSQEIHYLHGALHLFDAGDRLKKLTWVRTGISLVDQIRGQLAERSYPLVVTEGTAATSREDLFIYGHSLADNDEHILDAIERGGLRRIFVSVYGDSRSDENQGLIERAMLLSDRRASFVAATERRTARSLDVVFYDAASAQVWDRFSN